MKEETIMKPYKLFLKILAEKMREYSLLHIKKKVDILTIENIKKSIRMIYYQQSLNIPLIHILIIY